MPEESHVLGQPGSDAADRPAFSVRAVLCESAQLMMGEVYVKGGVRRTLSSPCFPFRIPRIGVAAFVYVPCARIDEEHTLTIRLRDSDERDLPLGIRRPDRSDLTDAVPQPIYAREYHFNTRRALDPRVDAGPMQLPFCANFVDLGVECPGNYYFALAIDDIELSRAPFLVAALQQSAKRQPTRAR